MEMETVHPCVSNVGSHGAWVVVDSSCRPHKLTTYIDMLGCLSAWMVSSIFSGFQGCFRSQNADLHERLCRNCGLPGQFLSQAISGQHGIILTPKVINIAQCCSLWKNFTAETFHVHWFGWTTPPFLRAMSFCSRLPSTPFPFMPRIVPCFWPWSPMMMVKKGSWIPTVSVAGVAWNF